MAKRKLHRKESPPPVPTRDGSNYARVPEGRYQAVAVRHQGPVWVRRWSRWTLLAEFALLDDGSLVCRFYNFGHDPSGPKVARGSDYFKAWTQANGDLPRRDKKCLQKYFGRARYSL